MRAVLACVFVYVLTGISMGAEPVPAPPQTRPIALVGGVVFPVDAPPIEGGVVLFDQGRIVAVGRDVALPPGTRVIDTRGKHVYPGLIDAWTELGIIEIGAVRATVDTRETGPVNPNLRVERAVNPDSAVIPTTRSNGVLIVLTRPTGGLISGQAAVIQLDGWTWEDMTLLAPAGLVVNWPDMLPAAGESDAQAFARQRESAVRSITDLFDNAARYLTAVTADPEHPVDLRWEAMRPYLQGEKPVMVVADEQSQIESAVRFAVERKLMLVIVGGRDAEACAAMLVEHDIPVILDGIHRLPAVRHADFDAPFTLPARLKQAGVRLCISASRGHTWVRNLPFEAGHALAFGMDEADVLRAITLDAAEILGIADQVGSITVGKRATLIVSDGDILEVTSRVERAFIDGREIDLSDRHKKLFDRFAEKYRQLGLRP